MNRYINQLAGFYPFLNGFFPAAVSGAQVASGIVKDSLGQPIVSTIVRYMWLVDGEIYTWQWGVASLATTDGNGRITVDVSAAGAGDLMIRLDSDLTKVYFEPDAVAE